MIHHLAWAFSRRRHALRSLPQEPIWAEEVGADGQGSARRPVRPRPLTPWQVRPSPAAPDSPTRPEPASPATSSVDKAPGAGAAVGSRTAGVRICSDPTDARRTVIAGRFAAVCAALDRLVLEQEAAH